MTTATTTTHPGILLNGLPLDMDDLPAHLADELSSPQGGWDEVSFCFVCGRCTDHVAEHDDLVELGLAQYEDGGYVVIVDSDALYAYRDAQAAAAD